MAPCHEAPYVEVVAFRDCAAPEAQVEAPITGFELVDIEVVQPSDAEVSLIAEPDFEGVEAEEEQEDEEGDYEEYRRRRGAFV